MTDKIHVYLFDGYSDWEIAFLTPEIHKSEAFDIIYFADTKAPVTSMGGLTVIPNMALTDINADDVEMLVIPGGNIWLNGNKQSIDTLVNQLHEKKKSIAAICGATIYLAQLGILDSVKHTSNDLGYLKAVVPNYKGEDCYTATLACSDAHLITANGVAPIEFARAIFDKIKLNSAEDIEKWFQLFKNGIWSN